MAKPLKAYTEKYSSGLAVIPRFFSIYQSSLWGLIISVRNIKGFLLINRHTCLCKINKIHFPQRKNSNYWHFTASDRQEEINNTQQYVTYCRPKPGLHHTILSLPLNKKSSRNTFEISCKTTEGEQGRVNACHNTAGHGETREQLLAATSQQASEPSSSVSTQNRTVRRLRSRAAGYQGSIAAGLEGRAASQRLGFDAGGGWLYEEEPSPRAAGRRPPRRGYASHRGCSHLASATYGTQKPRTRVELAEAPSRTHTSSHTDTRRPLPPSSASQVSLTGNPPG